MNPLTTRAIVLLLSIATLGHAAQSRSTGLFQAYYDKVNSLMVQKNEPALEKLMLEYRTDDFQSLGKPDRSGKAPKLTRSEAIKQLKPGMMLMDTVTKASSHIDAISAGKDTAVLTVSSTVAATTKKMSDGRAHSLWIDGKSQDTWVRIHGVWKIKQIKTVARSLTVDGHQVPQK